MILSHEIPQGCKLYFGESAKIKRELENLASKILYKNGYAEIITPTFTYLEHQRNRQSREVVRTNNEHNHQIALRNDSTIDTMRLLAPHLRNADFGKKWFYIQPIFIYPTTEMHQIGVENLETRDIAPFITIALELLHTLSTKFFTNNESLEAIFLQLANVKIPKLCAEIFALPLSAFENIDVHRICSANKTLQSLLDVDCKDALEQFIKTHQNLPKELLIALEELLILARRIDSKHCIISPLYYAPMAYYTGLFFRFFAKNATLILGGEYTIEGQGACGVGIYTDAMISYALRSKNA